MIGGGVIDVLIQNSMPTTENLHKKRAGLLLAAALASTLVGCAINPQTGVPQLAPSVKAKFDDLFANSDPCSNTDRNIGIALGAGAGLLAAHYLGKQGGALVAGAALGSLVGGLIGNSMDKRRCALYHIAQQYQLRLISAPVTANKLGVAPPPGSTKSDALGLDVELANKHDEFVPGTAELTPQAQVYLAQIAAQYSQQQLAASLGPQATPAQIAQLRERRLLIVGHTDERDNVDGVDLARLSAARAKAVARLFSAHGVPAADIEYQGAGDALPIASNATDQGRSENNRVQIIDTPNLALLKRYAEQRAANPVNFDVARSAKQAAADAQQIEVTQAQAAAASPAPSESAAKPLWKRWAQKARQLEHRSAPPAAPESAHHEVAAASPAAALTHESAPQPQAISSYGFDGRPLDAKGYFVNLGATSETSMFSIFKSAHADAPVIIGSCAQDHPHLTTRIRNLASGRALPVDQSMPGLYGQPWFGTQGQAAVALLHVYVPLDGGSPVPPVTAEIFRRIGSGYGKLPLARFVDAPVNVYRGSQATLYRVFLHGGAQCLDLDVPTRAASARGLIVYRVGEREYEAVGSFTSRG